MQYVMLHVYAAASRHCAWNAPNALDLMVVCVESGLGLDQAVLQVAKELQFAHPEISEEFSLMNLELKAGKLRAEALRNLAARTGVDELKKLVGVLIQADRFGTSIAQSLRGHSEYMRVQTRQQAEEKAAKLGVKLVFPISLYSALAVCGDGGAGAGAHYARPDSDDDQHVIAGGSTGWEERTERSSDMGEFDGSYRVRRWGADFVGRDRIATPQKCRIKT